MQLKLILSLFFIGFALSSKGPEEAAQDFNIRPGHARETVSVEAGGVLCVFEFSANGGTSEAWSISLTVDSEGLATCMIGRPQPPSYLVFDHFQVALEHALIESAQIVDIDGSWNEGTEFLVEERSRVIPGPGMTKRGGLIDLITVEATRKKVHKKPRRAKKDDL
mmetsp:Transcript_5446/g.7650  ORF Transcript_5446/g.7650 Transcript_5446/m.7650 type:complete len:165 (+) Transcript_5446:51-545(+)